MKKFWVIVSMVFALTLTATHVEAKKFGGGKSFGKLFQTKPSPSKKAVPNNAGSSKQNNLARGGMMKGVLGGLLAGGLIAAMMGGAFEGIQIMDMILLAVIAFVLIRLFKGMMQAKASAMQPQPAYSNNQFRQTAQSGDTGSSGNSFFDSSPLSQKQPQNSYDESNDATFDDEKSVGFGVDESVPYDLPEDFDINSFLSGARDHFRTIQTAWNENNLTAIQEYVSEELLAQLIEKRAGLAGYQHTEVMFVDAELVRADQNPGIAELSIKFSGRYRDAVEDIEEDITDIWHLQRDTTVSNAPWLIVGIEG